MFDKSQQKFSCKLASRMEKNAVATGDCKGVAGLLS